MFSGIVECIGIIVSLYRYQGCKHFTIAPKLTFNDLTIGDSIAVNGVCLTITALNEESFSVTAVPETLRQTNLDHLIEGDTVNLERAIQMGARIGGHYVQGHIDGIGQILEIENDHSNALIVKISVPQHLARYIVNKGYVGLDGMSITVINAAPEWFTVTFIPHIQIVTVANRYQKGTFINIETDVMGKQIEKLLGAYQHAIAN